MAKLKTAFYCTDCGNDSPRWQGQCPVCGAWNTLVEEPLARPERGSRAQRAAAAAPAVVVRLAEVTLADATRRSSGMAELDFVLGGGIVPGSITLIGGEPGIGKSTLLLQVAASLHAQQASSLYVSGEESAAQVRLRADRIGDAAAAVAFLAETQLDAVLAAATAERPAALVIDSIQTLYATAFDGAPGSVTQVRECAARLQRFAKETGTAVFLIGHVTKGGTVAGPKMLEHIVDTVLYFEETGTLDHRVLRATKNRFGSAEEIAVFRMTATGLAPVANPSELFLQDRARASGAAVAAVIEGTRALLVEVQALCTSASYGAPQRVAAGIDRQRLALLLAVLEKRAGLALGGTDVFVNVVGGLRISETACDMAVAAALASSMYDRVLPADTAFVGELGLGGELRGVGQIERRSAEVERMGFRTLVVPERSARRSGAQLDIIPVRDVAQLLDLLFR